MLRNKLHDFVARISAPEAANPSSFGSILFYFKQTCQETIHVEDIMLHRKQQQRNKTKSRENKQYSLKISIINQSGLS